MWKLGGMFVVAFILFLVGAACLKGLWGSGIADVVEPKAVEVSAAKGGNVSGACACDPVKVRAEVVAQMEAVENAEAAKKQFCKAVVAGRVAVMGSGEFLRRGDKYVGAVVVDVNSNGVVCIDTSGRRVYDVQRFGKPEPVGSSGVDGKDVSDRRAAQSSSTGGGSSRRVRRQDIGESGVVRPPGDVCRGDDCEGT